MPKALTANQGLYHIQDVLASKHNTKIVHHPLDLGVVYDSITRRRQPFFSAIQDLVKRSSDYSNLVILFDVAYDVPGQPTIRHSVCAVVKYDPVEVDIFDSNGLESNPNVKWTFQLSEILLHLSENITMKPNKTIIYDRFINSNSVCDNWVHFFLCKRVRDGLSQQSMDDMLESISELHSDEITAFADEITEEIMCRTI